MRCMGPGAKLACPGFYPRDFGSKMFCSTCSFARTRTEGILAARMNAWQNRASIEETTQKSFPNTRNTFKETAQESLPNTRNTFKETTQESLPNTWNSLKEATQESFPNSQQSFSNTPKTNKKSFVETMSKEKSFLQTKEKSFAGEATNKVIPVSCAKNYSGNNDFNSTSQKCFTQSKSRDGNHSAKPSVDLLQKSFTNTDNHCNTSKYRNGDEKSYVANEKCFVGPTERDSNGNIIMKNRAQTIAKTSTGFRNRSFIVYNDTLYFLDYLLKTHTPLEIRNHVLRVVHWSDLLKAKTDLRTRAYYCLGVCLRDRVAGARPELHYLELCRMMDVLRCKGIVARYVPLKFLSPAKDYPELVMDPVLMGTGVFIGPWTPAFPESMMRGASAESSNGFDTELQASRKDALGLQNRHKVDSGPSLTKNSGRQTSSTESVLSGRQIIPEDTETLKPISNITGKSQITSNDIKRLQATAEGSGSGFPTKFNVSQSSEVQLTRQTLPKQKCSQDSTLYKPFTSGHQSFAWMERFRNKKLEQLSSELGYSIPCEPWKIDPFMKSAQRTRFRTAGRG